MDRVVVTNPMLGIFSMQVCACKDATDEEILRACNDKNPAGTTNGWGTVVREGDEAESLRPVQCSDDPNRQHLIIHC